MLLKDKVAIITGAARGIGAGIALKFAEEGCSVVVVDIADEPGNKLTQKISRNGPESLYIHCNVTDFQQIEEMTGKILDKFGKIDILVNNAGGVTGPDHPIEDVSIDEWNKIIALNLTAHFLTCKAVVPHMKKRLYGKIVNVSSMGAVHPPAPIIHYHSAKAGVMGLTANLAFELAKFNITVNALLPGPIKTEFYDDVVKDMPDPQAFFNKLANNVPMKRMGTPEDTAGVALFLASDLSSYVTGESIFVGGGLPLAVQP